MSDLCNFSCYNMKITVISYVILQLLSNHKAAAFMSAILFSMVVTTSAYLLVSSNATISRSSWNES